MVEIARLRLNLLGWGQREARVLLLHGLGSSAATWGPIVSRLDQPAIAPDLRGHGLSPRGDSYLIADYVSDVLALGSGWDLVVAHSLGGLIAADAAQDPEWARQLVLIDPALEIEDSIFDAVAEANLREITDAPDAAHFQAVNPYWSADDAWLKAEAVRLASPAMAARTLFDNAPWRYAHLLESLPIPTLILGADPAHDAVFDPRHAEGAVAANPHLSYRTVLGAGHSVHRDDPRTVLAALRELFA